MANDLALNSVELWIVRQDGRCDGHRRSVFRKLGDWFEIGPLREEFRDGIRPPHIPLCLEYTPTTVRICAYILMYTTADIQ